MVRNFRYDPREIEMAMRAASKAETAMQLRQIQTILIPALAGVSLEVTARILGLSRSRVSALRKQYRTDGTMVGGPAKRGGRRRALMSFEDEKRFLAPWFARLLSGEDLPVAAIRMAYERAVARSVQKSTIYRLLARHGWRENVVATVSL